MNPISNLTLYNCKLDRTMHKTIDFSNQSARDSYFSSNNAIATIVSTPFNGDAYFIRENNTIKVGINADILDFNGVNYCRFNNPQSGTNSYFYAFIDNIEYSAPYTSILHIRTDVMLTNMRNFTTNECFVERSHIAKSDDDFYNQITPESVDYGDICIYSDTRVTTNLSARTLTEFGTNYYICLNMSEPLNGAPFTHINYIGAVPNLSYFYCFDWTDLNYINDQINQHGQSEAVISIFAVPKIYVSIKSTINYNGHDLYVVDEKDYSDFQTFLIVNYPTMANGYNPRNKKLLCYPYNYLRLHNHNNSSIDLKWENSTNPTGEIDIKTVMAMGTNANVIAIPVNYENFGSDYYSEYLGNYENAVDCNGFPEIPWITDTYKTYIALNKNSIETQKINMTYNSSTKLIKNIANQNPTGIVTSLTEDFLTQQEFENQMTDMQKQPDKIHGTIPGNVGFKCGSLGIFVSRMSCKTAYAEKIDKYFDMYGYNISAVQTPNWTNRAHYNYVKTSGIDIYGAISKNDKEEIANIFNSGVTFWHISGGGVYGTYDVNNN